MDDLPEGDWSLMDVDEGILATCPGREPRLYQSDGSFEILRPGRVLNHALTESPKKCRVCKEESLITAKELPYFCTECGNNSGYYASEYINNEM
jgi:hypothetical protein